MPQVWVRWHERWYRLDFAFLVARLALEYDGINHDIGKFRLSYTTDDRSTFAGGGL